MDEQFGWAQWGQIGPAPLDAVRSHVCIYTQQSVIDDGLIIRGLHQQSSWWPHSHARWSRAVGKATQVSGPCVSSYSRLAWAHSHGVGVRVPKSSKRGWVLMCKQFASLCLHHGVNALLAKQVTCPSPDSESREIDSVSLSLSLSLGRSAQSQIKEHTCGKNLWPFLQFNAHWCLF